MKDSDMSPIMHASVPICTRTKYPIMYYDVNIYVYIDFVHVSAKLSRRITGYCDSA